MATRLTYLVLAFGTVGLSALAYAQGTGTGVFKLPQDGMSVNVTWICPPSRSAIAGPAPRYGTCTKSTPVIILKYSPITWAGLPVPPEPMLILPGLDFA